MSIRDSFGRPVLLTVAVLALSGSLAACSKSSDSSTQGKTAASSQSQAAPAAQDKPASTSDTGASASDDAALEQKLSLYIDCYNRLDGAAHRSIARYASWVRDMKAGPTGHETIVYGLYPIDPQQTKTCQDTFAKAAAQAPALADLDGDGKKYIQALDDLSGVVQQAYTYYDRKDYKDDGFAKGKKLHPELVQKMTVFLQASDVFATELDKQNDVVFVAHMKKIEKEQGRKIPYLEMAVMHEAKQLAGAVDADQFDVAEAGKHMDAYGKVADEIQAYATAHPKEQPMGWSHFDTTVEDFRKAAKERIRRIRDNTPYTASEKSLLAAQGSSWMVEGSRGKVVKAYNSLVSAGNMLN